MIEIMVVFFWCVLFFIMGGWTYRVVKKLRERISRTTNKSLPFPPVPPRPSEYKVVFDDDLLDVRVWLPGKENDSENGIMGKPFREQTKETE